MFRQVRGDGLAFVEHPGQPAIAGAFEDRAAGRQVQARQQGADFRAVMGVGLPFMAARQAGLQQCRLALQLAQRLAVAGAHGVGHRQVGRVQHVEQGDEERQVLHRAALDQGQDVFALFQADEEVAVFRSLGDAAEVRQPAEPVGGEEFFQHRAFEGGEYRHVSVLDCTAEAGDGTPGYQEKISHCGISMSGWSERMKLPSLPSARTRK
ncbi:hypothetical protein D9M71_260450 [compost metagenome]